MKHAKARCVGGPLDGQTVEVEASFVMEVRFGSWTGPDDPPKFHTYSYTFDLPGGISKEAARNWTEVEWVATLQPDLVKENA